MILKRSTRKPRHNRQRPTRKGSRARHATPLEVILDESLPDKRRAAMARWALRAGQHTEAALAVLKVIVARPDKSMTVSAVDMLLKALHRSAPRPSAPRVLPDNPWARSIIGLPLYAGVKLIPQDEFDRLPESEQWPLSSGADEDDPLLS
jgi:hypothetical protein